MLFRCHTILIKKGHTSGFLVIRRLEMKIIRKKNEAKLGLNCGYCSFTHQPKQQLCNWSSIVTLPVWIILQYFTNSVHHSSTHSFTDYHDSSLNLQNKNDPFSCTQPRFVSLILWIGNTRFKSMNWNDEFVSSRYIQLNSIEAEPKESPIIYIVTCILLFNIKTVANTSQKVDG